MIDEEVYCLLNTVKWSNWHVFVSSLELSWLQTHQWFNQNQKVAVYHSLYREYSDQTSALVSLLNEGNFWSFSARKWSLSRTVSDYQTQEQS